ncbi:MAG: pyruvate formate lyase family protein [Planctomycetota bacterium]
MDWKTLYTADELHTKADAAFAAQKRLRRLDGWFRVREIVMRHEKALAEFPPEIRAGRILERIVEELPLSLDENAVFAGTQNDAFARSYALINPNFSVETFEGYCDPLAVYHDIEPSDEFPLERIRRARDHAAQGEFARELREALAPVAREMKEAVFFVEPVTGHVIPDFRPALGGGVAALRDDIARRRETAPPDRRAALDGMAIALDSAIILARRYTTLARDAARVATGARREQLRLIADTCDRVPASGARNLYEAIQSFLLLWQIMCLEQSPNPFAFSVGNIDRILEPYRAEENADRAMAAALFRHFLVFFNVGDRSWAISQNVMIGGKGADGQDLTSGMTFVAADAFFTSNFPQPNLSVKLHAGIPDALYKTMGRFFFTPGRITPSLFNDDALFDILRKRGVAEEDLSDYAIAGCQEPLIAGRENANTTNAWLNLAKILELTLNDGRSALTGEAIGPRWRDLGITSENPGSVLKQLRPAFYRHVEMVLDRMTAAANACTAALARQNVPFLSAFLGGIPTMRDARDTAAPGTPYHGSGCLIHGLSVVADSFTAVDSLIRERPGDAARLLEALRNDFRGAEDLRQYLAACEKFGNNRSAPDDAAREIAGRVSDAVAARRNLLGSPFRPDWSTPSTHLLYGHRTGATPDGRRARAMLGYGVDPLHGAAPSGLGFRILSTRKLPFDRMTGGYASHFGIDAKYFPEKSPEDRGLAFRNRVVAPLFFTGADSPGAPYYLYVNVNTPDMLRRVLAEPKRYAPDGVYIMRIHGTFVNFLDLSPAIQQDILLRLDLESTAMEAAGAPS